MGAYFVYFIDIREDHHSVIDYKSSPITKYTVLY